MSIIKLLVFFYIYIILLIYLFTFGCAVSSLLHGLFPSCSEQGLLLAWCRGLLTTVASPAVEHGIQGAWASAAAAPGL